MYSGPAGKLRSSAAIDGSAIQSCNRLTDSSWRFATSRLMSERSSAMTTLATNEDSECDQSTLHWSSTRSGRSGGGMLSQSLRCRVLPQSYNARMKTLFDDGDRAALLQRLDKLQADTPRQWGKMNAAQMVTHCTRALEAGTGDRPMKQKLIGKILMPFFR